MLRQAGGACRISASSTAGLPLFLLPQTRTWLELQPHLSDLSKWVGMTLAFRPGQLGAITKTEMVGRGGARGLAEMLILFQAR